MMRVAVVKQRAKLTKPWLDRDFCGRRGCLKSRLLGQA